MTDSARVAGFWNTRHQDPEGEAHDNFLVHPLIQAYISMRAFDSTLRGHLDIVREELERRTEKGNRILSVGCGLAPKERVLARQLPDREFVALDLADQIVDLAREEISREGLDNLEVQVGDFNALSLEADSFDAILGLGAIHHVERLEQFWSESVRGLRAGGCVIAQEYVGASRFQWTDAQVEHGSQALEELVPDEHKPHHRTVERPPVELMLQLDPSEAVRSDEILSTCKAAGFDASAYTGAGCGLIQPVLMNQISTFEPTVWAHNAILGQLFAREDQLMRDGVLDDDFAMFVAVPPT